MKTTKPNQFNYQLQYSLMKFAAFALPRLPRSMTRHFVATATERMLQAERHPQTMHVDRFDMVVDWGCVANSATKEFEPMNDCDCDDNFFCHSCRLQIELDFADQQAEKQAMEAEYGDYTKGNNQ
jgi:hypothetical protein